MAGYGDQLSVRIDNGDSRVRLKACFVCRAEKPTEAFARDKSRKDGLSHRCRECRRDAHLRDDGAKERSRRYLATRREAVNARNLAYYHANKNARSKKMAEWYLRNKNRVAENVLAFRRANPGWVAQKQAKRRASVKRAVPLWANLTKIAEIYATCAGRTLTSGEPRHVDHIVPLQGKTVCGLHCEANLTILPATENISKSNRYWPDMWEVV
jgi:hypothetical protein